jgi:hypothetical protein
MRGRVKGYFELHFDGTLEKEVVITRKLCGAWNEVAAVYILSGKRSDPEFSSLFESHFKIKLKKVQTVHELCTGWNSWNMWMKENNDIWEGNHQ